MVGEGGDGYVDLSGLQFWQGFGGIASLDVDRHLRVGFTEPAENLRQDGEYGGYRTIQSQFAAQGGITLQTVLQDGPPAHGFFAIFLEECSRLGKADGSVVAGKKGLAHLIFQALDGPGQTRSGNIAFNTGAAEMQGRSQVFKEFQFSDIHDRAVEDREVAPSRRAGAPLC